MAANEVTAKEHKKSKHHTNASPLAKLKKTLTFGSDVRHTASDPSISSDQEGERSLELKRSILRRERSHSRRMIKFTKDPISTTSQRSMRDFDSVPVFFMM